MNSRLEQVKNWPVVAQTVGYHASDLAAYFNVCLRHLERVLRTKLGASPHKLLHDLRMERALQMLKGREQIKTIAADLGYKYPAHFARDFKKYFGVPPSKHLLLVCAPPTLSHPLTLLCVLINCLDESSLALAGLLMS